MVPADEDTDSERTNGEALEGTHERPRPGKRRLSEDGAQPRQLGRRKAGDYKNIVERMVSLIRKYSSESSAPHASGIPSVVSGYDLAYNAVTKGKALVVLMASGTDSDDDDECAMLSSMMQHLANECRVRNSLYAFIDMSAEELGALANLPPSVVLCLTRAGDEDRLEISALKSRMQASVTRSERVVEVQRQPESSEPVAPESMEPSSHGPQHGGASPLPTQRSRQQARDTTQIDAGLETHDIGQTSTEPFDLSSKSSVLDDSTKKRLALEEEIVTHEIVLQSLKARKSAIDETLKECLIQRNNVRADISRLQAHQLELRTVQQSQKELCDILHGSLTENRRRLLSLLDGMDVTADELAELLNNEGGFLLGLNETDHVNNEEGTTNIHGGPSDSSKQEALMPTEVLDNLIEVSDMPLLLQRLENPMCPMHPAMSPELLRRFWQLGGEVNRVITFLPMLSAYAVRRIMDFTVTDLAASENDPMLRAKQRRHAMCFTCLDFRQLRISLESRGAEHCLSLTMNGHGPDTDFNPHVTLCPYELSGTCGDRYCPFQHLKPRGQESVLPRELLSLPHLKQMNNVAADKAKKIENSNQLKRRFIPTEKNSKKKGPTASFTFNSDDFIRLPSPDSSDYSSDENTEEIEGSDKSKTSDGIVHSRWLLSVSADSSVEVVLQELWFRINNTEKTSVIGMWESLTVILDFIRFAIHAGRFDFCEVLKDMLSREFQSIFESKLLGNCQLLFEGVWSEITDSINKAFAQNASECEDMFTLSFGVQFRLSNLSMFAGLVHTFWRRSSPSLSSPKEDTWLREAIEFFDVHNGANYETQPAWSSEFITSTIFIDVYKGLLISENTANENVFGLLNKLCTCRRTLESVQLDSMTTVIEGAWSHASSLLILVRPSTDSQSLWVEICILSLMASILFDAMRRLADPATSHDHILQIHNSVLKILWDLRDDARDLPLFDLLLAPVLAGAIAMICAMRQYAQAHQLLESFIIHTCPSGFLHLSELLWSQMVQLRLTFSPSSAHTKNVVEDNSLIIDKLNFRGVNLHHLVLSGDWNLVTNLKAMRVNHRTVTETCTKIARTLLFPKNGASSVDINLDGCGFSARCGDFSVMHEFPTSILLIGASVKDLSLNRCEINKLPRDFGTRFPNLEKLCLDNNLLSSFPPSFHLLQQLKMVHVASNKLETLPTTFAFPHLEELVLSHNLLKHLPMSMIACQNLQVLLVDGNDLDTSLLMVICELPKLRLLLPAV